ncbi:MAG: glycosyltransferase family 4 protein [Bryobacterales bacterium]|nr:glycosyltransferase family 4 protein [Bryobacterales bacterium]
MKVALDATYSIGDQLTGVGVYSRELLHGLATHPGPWLWCYRSHRFLASLRQPLPPGCSRRPLLENWVPRASIFHGLNQRLPAASLRRAAVTFHDLFVLTAGYSTPEFRARFSAQARFAAQRADAVLAVSAFTASQLSDLLNVEPSRITVTPHGIRFREFPAVPRQPVVLCVGALQKRKNTARLVRAFAAMPQGWRLVLAGSHGFEAQETLDAISASPRRADITTTGFVTDHQLATLYAQASIFAFPSLDEGFGIPLLEAMMAQVPVLTSNRSALPEVAGDAALLVDPFQEEEIADGLRRLALDEVLRATLIEKGIVRAALFRWEDTVQKTLRVYRQLS